MRKWQKERECNRKSDDERDNDWDGGGGKMIHEFMRNKREMIDWGWGWFCGGGGDKDDVFSLCRGDN